METIRLFTPIYYSHGDNIGIPMSGFSYLSYSEAYNAYKEWQKVFNNTNEWDILETIYQIINND